MVCACPRPRGVVECSADSTTPACVILPGGDYAGQYDMTFEFTIETLP